MTKRKTAPRKGTRAKAATPAPATLAEKNAAWHRRRLAEFKKKQKAKQTERDREFAALPQEVQDIHRKLKFGDLDTCPDGDAELLAVDLADLMFRHADPSSPWRRGPLDLMEDAQQSGFFRLWTEHPETWRALLNMMEIGTCAFNVALEASKLKAEGKRAFVTAFADTLARCILSDGSFDPPSDQMRKRIVANEYWRCVKHYKRNVRRVEFCEWLRALAARVEKDGRDNFFSELARQFEPRGQGPTRYAKPAGITFVEKRGQRLGGK